MHEIASRRVLILAWRGLTQFTVLTAAAVRPLRLLFPTGKRHANFQVVGKSKQQ